MYLSRKEEIKHRLQTINDLYYFSGAIYVVKSPLLGKHVRPSVRLFIPLYFCNTVSISKQAAGY
jgi:hypothetical protein